MKEAKKDIENLLNLFYLIDIISMNEKNKIKINPILFILAELTLNFKRFEVREFARLRSSYAKQNVHYLYSIIQQVFLTFQLMILETDWIP